MSSPGECPRCGTPLATRPNIAIAFAVAVLQNLAVFGGIVASLWLVAWWPVILGGAMGIFGFPLLLAWLSPVVVALPQAVTRARRIRFLFLAAFGTAVLLAAAGIL
jgi:hypothetical protein